ncbi:MAG: 3-oxoacid CoA-transferase subunit B [Dehalococcoidia bacterium]
MPERLDPAVMAMRVTREFFDGAVVNLGVGLPLLCADHLPEGREILLHSEQGLVGFGPIIHDPDRADPAFRNAGAHPVTPLPGMALMSHDESFAMVRGGHLDFTVLGALQVSARGDLANTHVPGKVIGNLGGAPDLATCAKRVIVMMYHTASNGKPKILRACDMTLTAPACVDLIVSDAAVIEVTPAGLVLKECAPGWTFDDVQAITEAPLIAPAGADDRALAWSFV